MRVLGEDELRNTGFLVPQEVQRTKMAYRRRLQRSEVECNGTGFRQVVVQLLDDLFEFLQRRLHACMCVEAYVVGVGAHVRVRACERACIHACVRACVRGCVHMYSCVSTRPNSSGRFHHFPLPSPQCSHDSSFCRGVRTGVRVGPSRTTDAHTVFASSDLSLAGAGAESDSSNFGAVSDTAKETIARTFSSCRFWDFLRLIITNNMTTATNRSRHNMTISAVQFDELAESACPAGVLTAMICDGKAVGTSADALAVGFSVGVCVGKTVGSSVGVCVGMFVGMCVGI